MLIDLLDWQQGFRNERAYVDAVFTVIKVGQCGKAPEFGKSVNICFVVRKSREVFDRIKQHKQRYKLECSYYT